MLRLLLFVFVVIINTPPSTTTPTVPNCNLYCTCNEGATALCVVGNSAVQNVARLPNVIASASSMNPVTGAIYNGVGYTIVSKFDPQYLINGYMPYTTDSVYAVIDGTSRTVAMAGWGSTEIATTTTNFHWARLDLQKSYDVQTVSLYYYNYAMDLLFRIQVGNVDSPDGNPSCAIDVTKGALSSSVVNCAVSGRYVYVVASPGSKQMMRLQELQVYGTYVLNVTCSACTCNAGYTGPSGGVCLPCAANTYKNATGSMACTNCLANSNSPISSTNIASCTCNPGYAGSDT